MVSAIVPSSSGQAAHEEGGYPVAFPPGTHYDTRVVPPRRRLARLRYRRLNERGTSCRRRPMTCRSLRRKPRSRSSICDLSICRESGSISRSPRESCRMTCSPTDSGLTGRAPGLPADPGKRHAAVPGPRDGLCRPVLEVPTLSFAICSVRDPVTEGATPATPGTSRTTAEAYLKSSGHSRTSAAGARSEFDIFDEFATT